MEKRPGLRALWANRRGDRSRKTKARNGCYAGRMAPIGYKTKRGDKALILDEEKVSTVKRVFEIREAM